MKKYCLCQVILLALVFIGVCVGVDASSMPSWNSSCVSDCIAYSGSGTDNNCALCCNDTNNLSGSYSNGCCTNVSAYGNETGYYSGNGTCSVPCNAVVSQPPAQGATCMWNPGQLDNTFSCGC